MDHIPDDLLELQARFDQWRANRKYNREPIPDQLRDAALEMSRRYPPSLLRPVLKIQLCLFIAKSPNLQKTLDFPAGSQYSRRGNEWFNCLHLGVLLRLQSAS